ncbi:MAG: type III secretion system export apparatus subunit SctV [Pseudomonadales bacterium]|nr:type III secretion system export apparatus subunit SctV [Pseudomonadales bacterium]
METSENKEKEGFFSLLSNAGYRDVILAAGIVMIVALMIFPLPLALLDSLIAVNILLAISLVLIGIYIPSPVAFSSFPSVILLSTLFRLSLSIATTRLILLNADAGDIIDTFGRIVVGGNIVVGLVIFIIITVVQFVVIAKGAERVAEVAARFTLDAMPGKQLSIDSDLRSGLLDKEEAKKKRRNLEVESQLHGSLDGAMKFVKGDAIAGIVIVIINILGGLTIGIMQRDMSFGDAIATYSILTIGDGLVAQIPALLTSIAAGLIITRSESDNAGHLGDTIAEQLTSHSRVVLIAALISCVLMLVPGFPWPVFLVLAILLMVYYCYQIKPAFLSNILSLNKEDDASLQQVSNERDILPISEAILRLHPELSLTFPESQLKGLIKTVFHEMQHYYGVPLPTPEVVYVDSVDPGECQLFIHEICVMRYKLKAERGQESIAEKVAVLPSNIPIKIKQLTNEVESADEELKRLTAEIIMALSKNLGMFLGIQETSNLVTLWNRDYPDLVKECLRVIVPQHLSEILKRLLNEGVSIRNLRVILEAVTEAGGREKDLGLLTEFVRVAMKKHITQQFCGSDKKIKAVMIHPELDDELQQVIRNSGGNAVTLEPEKYRKLIDNMRDITRLHNDNESLVPIGVVCSMEVRRYLRKMLAEDYFSVPVISYMELMDDVQIEPIAQLNAA